jgi:hypothetical protein
MKNTSSPMKMIGAHVMIQLSIWYQATAMPGVCPVGRKLD